jgi:hypothetical protein
MFRTTVQCGVDALGCSEMRWYWPRLQCSVIVMFRTKVQCGVDALGCSEMRWYWPGFTVQCGGIGLDYSAVRWRWRWPGLQCSAVVLTLQCSVIVMFRTTVQCGVDALGCSEMRWYWPGLQCSAVVLAWITVQCGGNGSETSP